MSHLPTMKTMLRRLGGFEPAAVLGVAAQLVLTLGSGVEPLWCNYLADHDNPVDPWQQLWAMAAESEPWLEGYLGPLVDWVEHTGDAGAMIKAVAEAYRGVDLLELVSYDGPHQGEYLGPLYLELMSAAGRSAKGAFYTPMNVSRMLAMMSGIEEGGTVGDPCCGAGAMLIASAHVMREAKLDPSTVLWVANDIDPMAVALAGVNMTVRGMGPHIWLSVGDGLQLELGTDGDPHRTQRPWWEREQPPDPLVAQVAEELVHISPPFLSAGGSFVLRGADHGKSLGDRRRRSDADLAPPGEGSAT